MTPRIALHSVAPDLTPDARYDWQTDALCAQVDQDVFHPLKGGSAIPSKTICSMCDVRAECLAYGMDDTHGIYGGLSYKERVRLAKTGWQPGDPAPPIRIARGGKKAEVAA